MSFGFSIGDFVTVIELANQLRKDFVSAPVQFKALSNELRSLSITVQDVEVDLSNTDLSNQQRLELQNLAESCRDVLVEIEKMISRYYQLDTSHGIKGVWKRLKWEPDDVRDLRNRICSNISLLNAFNGRITQANVMALMKHKTNEEHRACLDWLSPTTYAKQHCDYINRRQPGTGDWFLVSPGFRTWIEMPQQTLFCPGIPGAGKTILASVVIDELESQYGTNHDVGIAYFYCSYQHNDDQGQKLEILLAAVLRQLVQGLFLIPDTIHALHEKHRTKGTRPSVEELSRALRLTMAHFSRLFIVIDALDECLMTTISPLLDEIFGHQINNNLSFLATARFIPEIMARFQNKPMQEIRATKPDVIRYIRANLARLPPFVSRNPQLQQEIVTELTDAVNGMFLLAQLYVDSLMRKKSPKAIRSLLEELTNGSKTYDSAYDNAMQRIEDQVTDQKEMAWEVLSWITCAKRPLTTTEIQNALAVELGESDLDEDNISDLDDIISACAGLVTVTVDASSSVIRLVHYTAQEYFERTWTRWFPDAHKSIATTCVTYLSFNAFRAGICATDTEFEARLEEYPLYSYAARNWGHHAWMQLVSEDILIAFLEDTPKVDACVQAVFARKGFTSLGDYSPRVPLSFTGLHLAAYFGLAKTVWSLIQHCDQSHLKDSMGRTPLAWAAYTGHDSVVKFFLDKGVNACERDGDGRTPISLAASMGWVGVVNVLLEYHIDPDSCDVDDQTPLSWAAYRGHEEVVRLLLEKGANPDSKDKDGQTPLFWAASNGWVRLVALLLEHLVDPDPKDMHGRTPVSYAAENGDSAVVELLLEKGAKPDSIDIEAHSPLFWAAHYGHKGVLGLLQAKSAGLSPYVPTMDGTDCVMENTLEKEVSQSHPNTSSHPPLLKPKIAPYRNIQESWLTASTYH
ncbi:hypothetical protein DTO166G4_1133 [Paecilomyces variotii]|nr:hypothetical protein DTO166G4_1133 [Paecilomyces variotii]KAJ9231046.1 hypothetical protein DTO166G5_6961 [Paecilomyces variotii]